jgi:uncharacterized protein (DUF58 family)
MQTVFRRFYHDIKLRLQSFIRVAKSIDNVATLSARQIYILPSRWSVFYILMLIALLIGAINYTLSLAYFVLFLLASLAHTAMLHTWRNLAYLQVSVIGAQPTFAGDTAEVTIEIKELKNRARHAIHIYFADNMMVNYSIQANQTIRIAVPLKTNQRGYKTIPRIKLYTEFPLSLFHAWANVDSDMEYLVYPKPSQDKQDMPSTIDSNMKGNDAAYQGDEDFIGHKTYEVGDLPSKVDWKASSRGIGMYSKKYAGEASRSILLDWALTIGDKEARLSQLTRWVIDGHALKIKYGIKLDNGVQFPPSNTVAHYHHCLEALATR